MHHHHVHHHHHHHHGQTPYQALQSFQRSTLLSAHKPVYVIWASPSVVGNLGVIDDLTVNHAVVWLAALASAGVSAVPGSSKLISWDTAINEAMVLFIMRGTLGASVKRSEAKNALQEVGRSLGLTYKGVRHVATAAKWAKRTGHPLGAGLHAAVAGTSTFAVGLAAISAVKKRQLTAASLRAELPNALNASIGWAELIEDNPAHQTAVWQARRVGQAHELANMKRLRGPLLERPTARTQLEACRALGDSLTKRHAPLAAAACYEVGGAG